MPPKKGNAPKPKPTAKDAAQASTSSTNNNDTLSHSALLNPYDDTDLAIFDDDDKVFDFTVFDDVINPSFLQDPSLVTPYQREFRNILAQLYHQNKSNNKVTVNDKLLENVEHCLKDNFAKLLGDAVYLTYEEHQRAVQLANSDEQATPVIDPNEILANRGDIHVQHEVQRIITEHPDYAAYDEIGCGKLHLNPHILPPIAALAQNNAFKLDVIPIQPFLHLFSAYSPTRYNPALQSTPILDAFELHPVPERPAMPGFENPAQVKTIEEKEKMRVNLVNKTNYYLSQAVLRNYPIITPAGAQHALKSEDDVLQEFLAEIGDGLDIKSIPPLPKPTTSQIERAVAQHTPVPDTAGIKHYQVFYDFVSKQYYNVTNSQFLPNKTQLMFAMVIGAPVSVIDAMLQLGVNVRETDENGWTALRWALERVIFGRARVYEAFGLLDYILVDKNDVDANLDICTTVILSDEERTADTVVHAGNATTTSSTPSNSVDPKHKKSTFTPSIEKTPNQTVDFTYILDKATFSAKKNPHFKEDYALLLEYVDVINKHITTYYQTYHHIYISTSSNIRGFSSDASLLDENILGFAVDDDDIESTFHTNPPTTTTSAVNEKKKTLKTASGQKKVLENPIELPTSTKALKDPHDLLSKIFDPEKDFAREIASTIADNSRDGETDLITQKQVQKTIFKYNGAMFDESLSETDDAIMVNAVTAAYMLPTVQQAEEILTKFSLPFLPNVYEDVQKRGEQWYIYPTTDKLRTEYLNKIRIEQEKNKELQQQLDQLHQQKEELTETIQKYQDLEASNTSKTLLEKRQQLAKLQLQCAQTQQQFNSLQASLTQARGQLESLQESVKKYEDEGTAAQLSLQEKKEQKQKQEKSTNTLPKIQQIDGVYHAAIQEGVVEPFRIETSFPQSTRELIQSLIQSKNEKDPLLDGFQVIPDDLDISPNNQYPYNLFCQLYQHFVVDQPQRICDAGDELFTQEHEQSLYLYYQSNIAIYPSELEFWKAMLSNRAGLLHAAMIRMYQLEKLVRKYNAKIYSLLEEILELQGKYAVIVKTPQAIAATQHQKVNAPSVMNANQEKDNTDNTGKPPRTAANNSHIPTNFRDNLCIVCNKEAKDMITTCCYTLITCVECVDSVTVCPQCKSDHINPRQVKLQ